MNNTDFTYERPALYLLSFGESRRYRYLVTAREGMERLVRCERDLNEFLRSRFPGESFAYYTTPRLERIDPDREMEYADYEEFDSSHLEAIEEELLREVDVMHCNRELNSNEGRG